MVARDRGQVLLLGGLAIAIVFLTAIPLSNSLVVSESAASSDAVIDIDRTDKREAAVERGLVALTRSSTDRSPAALNRSLRNFTRYYTLVSAQQDGVYVNATLNIEETEGNYTDETLRTSPSMASNYSIQGMGPAVNDWNLSEDTNQIERFEVNVTESSGGPTNSFRILVTGDNGNTRELRAVSGGGFSTEIRDGAGATVCSGRTLDLDLLAGTCNGSSAFAPITDSLDKPYTVGFENGNRADGTYTYASTGEFPDESYDSGEYRPFGVRPAYDVRYVGSDVSYTQTIEVNATA